MKKNMGTADSAIRLMVAAIIAILYLNYVVEGTAGILLLVVAAILVVTSLFRICPLYNIIGVSTVKKRDPE